MAEALWCSAAVAKCCVKLYLAVSKMSLELFDRRYKEWATAHRGQNARAVDDDEHGKIVDLLTNHGASEAQTLSSKQRRWLTVFSLVDYGSTKKLVRKGTELEVVKTSEIFGKIHEMHVAGGHVGRDKLKSELAKKFYNISQKVISIYLGTCSTCEEKRKRPRKGVVCKPILSEDMCSRAQIDLICFESEKDGPYAYILNYQDHLTKFVSLRALKSKRAEEVAYHLLDIFCTFGAPAILQV